MIRKVEEDDFTPEVEINCAACGSSDADEPSAKPWKRWAEEGWVALPLQCVFCCPQCVKEGYAKKWDK